MPPTESSPAPESRAEVRVASPAAYAFQKALSFSRRAENVKKAKDLAYLFELLHNFPELEEDIRLGMKKLRIRYPESWSGRMQRNLGNLFTGPDSSGVRMVAQQKPHPYSDMVLSDATNGHVLFCRTVDALFRRFLADLDV